jgi:hypothetical protein
MNVPSSSLPPLLDELEAALSLVQQALTQRDALQLEVSSSQVQRLMARALAEAREQPLAAAERQRLAQAGARLAAQRQMLFRATTALDRALDTLMPAEPNPAGIYGESGRSLRKQSSGDSLIA